MSRCVQTILTGILTRNHSGSLSTTEWRDLILVARANSLLPRVASILLSDVENDFHIPPKAHAHLVASIRHETLFHNQVINEVKLVNAKISKALVCSGLLVPETRAICAKAIRLWCQDLSWIDVKSFFVRNSYNR